MNPTLRDCLAFGLIILLVYTLLTWKEKLRARWRESRRQCRYYGGRPALNRDPLEMDEFGQFGGSGGSAD